MTGLKSLDNCCLRMENCNFKLIYILNFFAWINFVYFFFSSDTKQNKGSILKASVDYITQIRSEIDDAKKIQETNKYLLTINKKLLNKIKVNFFYLSVLSIKEILTVVPVKTYG